jgi:hypothetical protein
MGTRKAKLIVKSERKRERERERLLGKKRKENKTAKRGELEYLKAWQARLGGFEDQLLMFDHASSPWPLSLSLTLSLSLC